MDILNADLQLKTEATSRKKGTKGRESDETDTAFHFIAFMPVMGQLWKFDGLERQPRALGMSQASWQPIILWIDGANSR
jgi:ubiquitin carboxyl-terminal hydrolase L5